MSAAPAPHLPPAAPDAGAAAGIAAAAAAAASAARAAAAAAGERLAVKHYGLAAGAAVPHLGCTLQRPLNGRRTVWRAQSAAAGAAPLCVKSYLAPQFTAAAAEAAASRRASAAGVLTPAHLAITSDANLVYSIFEWLESSTFYDFYGEQAERWEGVPNNARAAVRDVLDALYDEGILFRDRTAFNFIVTEGGEVAIVDFEHASLRDGPVPQVEREVSGRKAGGGEQAASARQCRDSASRRHAACAAPYLSPMLLPPPPPQYSWNIDFA
jgi:hypothetical protein